MGFIDGFRETLGLTPKNRVDLSRDSQPKVPSSMGSGWQLLKSQMTGQHDTYDNVFPYVNAVSQRFSTIIPYAVDSSGARITPAPQMLQALYAPNDMFSFREFLRYIASNMLTQSHLDILIWTRHGSKIVPGGKVTADNIAGFTFLPSDARKYQNSMDYYLQAMLVVDGEQRRMDFSRDETIALTYSVHPNDPTLGISPAMTVKQWATIDDFIADYESGFFANGAVPAGMLGIVSSDAQDFNTNKNRLEDAFRGADKTNGVVYNMIPVDPTTNKPSSISKLSWVPFQQSNNQLDIESLSGVVNNRLSNAMGVPDIIRGIDNGQTYANAQIAERTFVENTLQPLLLSVWDKWQFELDRITGGLGYGLTFDLDLPAQTDIENVQAETQQTQVNTLISLVNAGADVGSAVRALGLAPEYADLDLRAPGAETPQSDVSDISNHGENTLPPGQMEKPQDIEPQKPQPATQPDPEFTITDAHTMAAYHDGLKAAANLYKDVIKSVGTVKNALSDDTTPNRIADDWAEAAYEAYLAELKSQAAESGKTVRQQLEAMAANDDTIAAILNNVSDSELTEMYDWHELPENIDKAYTEHLQKVGKSAVETARDHVRDMLQQAQDEQWDEPTLEDNLQGLVGGESARLLAVNETLASQRLGSLYSVLNMQKDLHVEIQKEWMTTGNHPCEFCQTMNGKRLALDKSFMGVGESMEINGSTYVNDFESMQTADGHPNCQCVLVYTVKGQEPNV